MHKGEDVGVLIDEMKISEGLVYNASTGNLCGFIDSLDEESVLEFDENLDQPTNFASHALCFMIRGLKSNLQAVVATYATKSLSATQLYSRFWDLAAHLELVGLKVRCVVSDGASTNRRFYNLHAGDYQDPVTFRMKNKFTAEDRPIYLHLSPHENHKKLHGKCWWKQEQSKACGKYKPRVAIAVTVNF